MDQETLMQQQFKEKGSVLIKNTISKELCYFLTHVFLRLHHEGKIFGRNNYDKQVVDTMAAIPSNPYNDTFLEMCWPIAERISGEELIPTYSYARLYCNGNVLPSHIDRESCEVSMTIQLGRSHNYSWPIHVDGTRYDLEEGDAMMYLGCEKSHWREECKGPEGYYSGQLFIHFVKAKGEYKNFAGDKKWPKEIPFIRNRTFQMTNKNLTL